jgi:hypothetical protein
MQPRYTPSMIGGKGAVDDVEGASQLQLASIIAASMP